jgi:hypothetical protein
MNIQDNGVVQTNDPAIKTSLDLARDLSQMTIVNNSPHQFPEPQESMGGGQVWHGIPNSSHTHIISDRCHHPGFVSIESSSMEAAGSQQGNQYDGLQRPPNSQTLLSLSEAQSQLTMIDGTAQRSTHPSAIQSNQCTTDTEHRGRQRKQMKRRKGRTVVVTCTCDKETMTVYDRRRLSTAVPFNKVVMHKSCKDELTKAEKSSKSTVFVCSTYCGDPHLVTSQANPDDFNRLRCTNGNCY